MVLDFVYLASEFRRDPVGVYLENRVELGRIFELDRELEEIWGFLAQDPRATGPRNWAMDALQNESTGRLWSRATGWDDDTPAFRILMDYARRHRTCVDACAVYAMTGALRRPEDGRFFDPMMGTSFLEWNVRCVHLLRQMIELDDLEANAYFATIYGKTGPGVVWIITKKVAGSRLYDSVMVKTDGGPAEDYARGLRAVDGDELIGFIDSCITGLVATSVVLPESVEELRETYGVSIAGSGLRMQVQCGVGSMLKPMYRLAGRITDSSTRSTRASSLSETPVTTMSGGLEVTHDGLIYANALSANPGLLTTGSDDALYYEDDAISMLSVVPGALRLAQSGAAALTAPVPLGLMQAASFSGPNLVLTFHDRVIEGDVKRALLCDHDGETIGADYSVLAHGILSVGGADGRIIANPISSNPGNRLVLGLPINPIVTSLTFDALTNELVLINERGEADRVAYPVNPAEDSKIQSIVVLAAAAAGENVVTVTMTTGETMTATYNQSMDSLRGTLNPGSTPSLRMDRPMKVVSGDFGNDVVAGSDGGAYFRQKTSRLTYNLSEFVFQHGDQPQQRLVVPPMATPPVRLVDVVHSSSSTDELHFLQSDGSLVVAHGFATQSPFPPRYGATVVGDASAGNPLRLGINTGSGLLHVVNGSLVVASLVSNDPGNNVTESVFPMYTETLSRMEYQQDLVLYDESGTAQVIEMDHVVPVTVMNATVLPGRMDLLLSDGTTVAMNRSMIQADGVTVDSSSLWPRIAPSSALDVVNNVLVTTSNGSGGGAAAVLTSQGMRVTLTRGDGTQDHVDLDLSAASSSNNNNNLESVTVTTNDTLDFGGLIPALDLGDLHGLAGQVVAPLAGTGDPGSPVTVMVDDEWLHVTSEGLMLKMQGNGLELGQDGGLVWDDVNTTMTFQDHTLSYVNELGDVMTLSPIGNDTTTDTTTVFPNSFSISLDALAIGAGFQGDGSPGNPLGVHLSTDPGQLGELRADGLYVSPTVGTTLFPVGSDGLPYMSGSYTRLMDDGFIHRDGTTAPYISSDYESNAPLLYVDTIASGAGSAAAAASSVITLTNGVTSPQTIPMMEVVTTRFFAVAMTWVVTAVQEADQDERILFRAGGLVFSRTTTGLRVILTGTNRVLDLAMSRIPGETIVVSFGLRLDHLFLRVDGFETTVLVSGGLLRASSIDLVPHMFHTMQIFPHGTEDIATIEHELVVAHGSSLFPLHPTHPYPTASSSPPPPPLPSNNDGGDPGDIVDFAPSGGGSAQLVVRNASTNTKLQGVHCLGPPWVDGADALFAIYPSVFGGQWRAYVV